MKLISEVDFSRIDELETLLTENCYYFGQPASNRKAWDSLSPEIREHVLGRADELLTQEDVIVPDEVLLRYTTMGDRQVCDGYYERAAERVRCFAAACAIENNPKYILAYENAVKAKCDFKTWVGTAHDRNLDNFYGRDITIDLCSACFSWELALADCVLGDLVSPSTRELVRENLNRRTFVPFEQMLSGEKTAEWWFNTTNNWNAVCLGAVFGAALAVIEDKKKRALYAAAWEKYIVQFQAGFPEDGYCTEGPAYWAYGFSHYLYAAELMRQATNGTVDGMTDPKMQKVARFCLRMELPGKTYPAIADCTIGFTPQPRPMNYCCSRLGLPAYSSIEEYSPFYANLMFWFNAFNNAQKFNDSSNQPDNDFGYRTWFESVGVLLCRPGSHESTQLSACLKGGNNREHHNHNDVGTFIVSKAGVQLISDIGHEYYHSLTFTDKRYDSPFYSSYGHSVPRPSDALQCPQKDSDSPEKNFSCKIKETVFSKEQDCYTLDLKDVYNNPNIVTITRGFVYKREQKPVLSVLDNVKFCVEQSYETAIMTYGEYDVLSVSDNSAEIKINFQGQYIDISIKSTEPFTLSFEKLEGNIKYATNPHCYNDKLPTRIAVRLKEPTLECTIDTVIS